MNDREPNVGNFLNGIGALFRSNPIAVVIFILVAGVINEGYVLASENIDTVEWQSYLMIVAASFGFMIAYALLVAIPLYALSVAFLKSLGRWHEGEHLLPAYILMTAISWVGFVFGLIFFVVPAVMLIVRWSASAGFLISERMGAAEALSASWDGTRGYSWHIFGAGLIIFVPVIFGEYILLEFVSDGYVEFGTWPSFASSALSGLSGALTCALGIAIYDLVTEIDTWSAEVFD